MNIPTPTLPKREGAKCGYSITEVCPHDIAVINVISTCATCETTQLVCADCGQELEEPKTEC
jgi:hypothetical protein